MPFGADRLRQRVTDHRTDTDFTLGGTDQEDQHEFDQGRLTTVTELIDDLLQLPGLVWPGSSSMDDSAVVGEFASIRDVLAAYTLHKLQHIAFATIARSMLQRWRQDPAEVKSTVVSECERASKQLLMFMGGESGTGKSRAIQAVRQLCFSWHRSQAIILTAMIGKAPSIFNRRTLSSFGMALRTTGYSPYHLAVQHHSPHAIATLANHGANINLFDRNSHTPLVYAAVNGYSVETMDTLIQHGAHFRFREMRGRDAVRSVAELLTSWVYNLAPSDVPAFDSHSIVQDVDCVRVDEVSMMSKFNLLRLDRLFRRAKKVDNVPFGGLHVFLVGDFIQLPPARADPLFVDPCDKSAPEIVDFEGFNLWRQFD